MQRRWFVVLAIVLVGLTAGFALPASAASGADRTSPAQDSPQLGTPDGFNDTEFRLSVYENGTTRWTISHYRFLGDNQSKIDQYQSFADRFNSTETDTYRDFKTRARALVSFGAKETNRQMNATGFSKDAYIEQQFRGKVGVLEMSFSWTNFGRTTDRGVTVGDVFDGGMYIGPGQSLVFERPASLVFESTSPPPDSLGTEGNMTASSTLEYQGEQDFDDFHPEVVLVTPETLEQSDATVTPDSTTTPVTSTTQSATTGAKSNDFGTMPLAFAILFLLVLGGVIAWYTGNLGSVFRDRGDTDAESAAASPSETESAAEPGAPTESAVPEEELLSDEDRVLKLLDENGGRMKQVNIVENTEWSKSKVSMLLSDMAEEGLISKLRVGRENIISKAGEEPDAVGSPFDDE